MAFFGLFKNKNEKNTNLANSESLGFNKSKTSTSGISKLSSAITDLFNKRKLDEDITLELEELLIASDVGFETSEEIIVNLKKQKFSKNITLDEIKNFLASEMLRILKPMEKKLDENPTIKPFVMVFNGVNGVGKTTTIGKISHNLRKSDKKVVIAACDTFRAGASKQLEVWAERSGAEIILPTKDMEDAGAVAYRATKRAIETNADFLLIDTAGRLQNKQNLMDELKKINNVIKKIDNNFPHENILVIDSTTGQNAKNQLEIFDKIVNVTSLIITKLDGSAKGGILLNLANNYKKPIIAVGVGEKIDSLKEFDAKDFIDNILN